MYPVFLVMIGGAIGAGARYLVGRATLVLGGPGFPWGTLTVNLFGGFAMGLLVGWLARYAGGGEQLRLFAGVGVMGGFTTFSAFSLELVLMIERGAWLGAAGYAAVSLAGSVIALVAGLALTRVAA